MRRKSNVTKTEKTMEIAEIVNQIVKHQIRQRNSIVRTYVSYARYIIFFIYRVHVNNINTYQQQEPVKFIKISPYASLNNSIHERPEGSNRSTKDEVDNFIDQNILKKMEEKSKSLTAMLEKAKKHYMNELESINSWVNKK